MSGKSSRPDGPPRDSWIPWLFVGFFAVVVAANVTLAYLATTSFTGLQTEDHYRKGLAYNRVLAAGRTQSALGWTVSVGYSDLDSGAGRLEVRAVDRDRAPLDGATVTARLIRPTQAGHDLEVALAPAGNGTYAAEVELPLRGQWDIRTRIEHRSGTHRTVRRIVTR